MIAKPEPPPRIAILGEGRLAGAFLRALQAAGGEARTLSARALGAPPEAPVVIVAVSDDAVSAVAVRLADALGDGPPPRAVLQTSGVHDASVLAPLAARGIATGSLHPLQTFPPGSGAERFRGVTFAVDGAADAVAAARTIVTALGGVPVEIPPGRKALWHLAASLSANGAVGLVGAALDALGAVGLSPAEARRALAPLVTTAVAEAFARGPAAALTGPVARGDVETLARHRRALAAWDATRTALLEALVREQERLARERPEAETTV